MNKKLCRECLKKVKGFRPVAKLVNGTVEWVCERCWVEQGYEEVIK